MELDEQITKKKNELQQLERLKDEKENGFLARVTRVVAKSNCCDWINQRIDKLTFKESSFTFGDGIQIDFPKSWALFELTYDLHKAGFKVEQVTWKDDCFMIVSEGI